MQATTKDHQIRDLSSSILETIDNSTNRTITSVSLNRFNNPANNSTFEEQKKSYHLRKRYFTKNIQSAIETSQEVHSGWLKARTAFTRWTKVWCQVKPGYLIVYTSQEAQKKHRLGVVLLSVCQVIKRPTKKEGFCFKLINPFGCSVWAKSSTRALAFAQASLTLRASDSSIGKLWLDALNRCNLSERLDGYEPVVDGLDEGLHFSRSEISDSDDGASSARNLNVLLLDQSNNNSPSSSNLNNIQQAANKKPNSNGTACDKFSSKTSDASRFKSDKSSSQIGSKDELNNNRIFSDSKFSGTGTSLEVGSDKLNISLNCYKMVAKYSKYSWKELQLEGVNYIGDGAEELGSAGVQSEEVHDGNKNFLWHIIKQLRPGMDLSKVTLPTFILEPRSFLEKLADYYYHCDILSEAVLIDDPEVRMINIVRWYLSGFYKKPSGAKKPYNPILGERFRCFWDHQKTQSRTFFIAEQVSHHPPISAFHVTNRKDGFTITCALLTKSKFGGNSVSAILDGKAKLFLHRRNETYTLTMPFANCRGILLGSLCLELGGKVEIECIETGLKCELDFKLAPVWASSNSYNSLNGKILRGSKVTHTIDGHWDKKINILNKSTDEKSVLWEVTDSVRNSRLKRYTVSLKDQEAIESVRLWSKVTEAIVAGDQVMATTEKTRLEDLQRQEARTRTRIFQPEHFKHSIETEEWLYRWQDSRVWNSRRDIVQFEDNFKIKTLMFCSNLNPSNSNSATPGLDPNIDLPLTQWNRFSSTQTDAPQTSDIITNRVSNSEANQTPSIQPIDLVNGSENNQMKLMRQAIMQVAEKNKKLEEDLATLKRGKKTVAFIMATIIVFTLSMFLKYFS